MAKPTPEELAATAAAEAAAAEAAAAEAAAAEAALDPNEGTVLVETTGGFMLVDPLSGAEIEAQGATRVKDTSFIRDRIALGHLKLID